MVAITDTRFTVSEFAALVDRSTKTIWRWLHPGKAPQGIALAPTRIGGRVFISLENFIAWQCEQDARRARLQKIKQRYRRTITA